MRSKKPTVTPVVSADIEEVRHRLQEWRGSRRHGARIPEGVWIAAVKLAQKYRPSRIAHELGLDYDGLRRRLKTAQQHGTSEQETKPGFIELFPFAPTSHCACTLEIEDRHGAKMKLELKGASAGDVAAVSRALWSTER
jgi:hypothetical protein